MSTTFEITAGPYTSSELTVVSFQAEERVSALYRADVRVTFSGAPEGFDASVLGQSACLILSPGADSPGLLRGIVAAVEAEGAVLHDRRAYRLRIVPRLWRLKRRVTSRIFQSKSVVEIVDTVLAEHGIERSWRLRDKYPARPYCVQHAETDYRFITRLLAEEGVFFFFDHPSEGGSEVSELLVVGDASSAYAPIEGGEHLTFLPPQEGVPSRDDQVTRFALARRSRSRAALVRGYDSSRPLVDLRSAAIAMDPSEALTSADGAAGRAELTSDETDPFNSPDVRTATIYQHTGEQEESGAAPKTAAVLLEQERAAVALGNGETSCRRLVTGRRFTLDQHDITGLNQAYVLTRIEHEGYAAEVVPEGEKITKCVCDEFETIEEFRSIAEFKQFVAWIRQLRADRRL